MPFTDTVCSRPLWISPTQNRWCDILYAKGPGLVNRHYHPQQVFAYTISGKWGYLEHDWVATAGRLRLRGAGRGAHARRLRARRADEGALQRDGAADLARRERRAGGHFDVFDYIELCRAHYEQMGIGADYVEKLFR